MSSRTHRVLTCVADNLVSLQTQTIPEISDGEILVALKACGICGTDIAKIFDPYFKKPQKIGHELVGVVSQSKSQHFKVGERVAVAHHAPDLNSHYTLRGSAPMDPVFKSSNIEPCGFAEFIRVPVALVEQTVVPVPANVPDLRAAFMEPMACCLRALDRVDVVTGDSCLVIGVGAVGILFLPLLRDLGVVTLVMDVKPERLQLAEEWGAIGGLVAGQGDLPALAQKHSHGRGVDLVIVNVIMASTIEAALNAVRDGGTILLFGSKPNNSFKIDWWDIWRREINLISSYSSTPDLLPRAMQLLTQDDFALEKLVSHQFNLDNAAQGFAFVHEGRAGKVMIVADAKS